MAKGHISQLLKALAPPHLHLHVVPRTKGDGLRGFFWPRTTYADGEAGEYAARLRAALAP